MCHIPLRLIRVQSVTESALTICLGGSRRNLALVRYYYRAGGVKMVFRKIVDRIRFLFGSR